MHRPIDLANTRWLALPEQQRKIHLPYYEKHIIATCNVVNNSLGTVTEAIKAFLQKQSMFANRLVLDGNTLWLQQEYKQNELIKWKNNFTIYEHTPKDLTALVLTLLAPLGLHEENLFRIAVWENDMAQTTFIFSCNHLLTNNLKQIMTLGGQIGYDQSCKYSKVINNSLHYGVTISEFHDWIQKKSKLDVKANDLLVDRWLYYKKAVEDTKYNEFVQTNIAHHTMEFNLDERYAAFDLRQVAIFSALVMIISQSCEEKLVPFAILLGGRVFKDISFIDVVGDFSDYGVFVVRNETFEFSTLMTRMLGTYKNEIRLETHQSGLIQYLLTSNNLSVQFRHPIIFNYIPFLSETDPGEASNRGIKELETLIVKNKFSSVQGLSVRIEDDLRTRRIKISLKFRPDSLPISKSVLFDAFSKINNIIGASK